MTEWIVNPSIDMVGVLEQYGRFLENDYRMAIESMYVPSTFDEYSEVTGRKFIIIGGKEKPGLIAKSVFLCLKLAGPESIVVSVPSLDEMFMVQNVFEYYGEGVRHKLFTTHHDMLNLEPEWREEVEQATDIVVYGDKNTLEAWRDFETVDRHVWEHGYSFSFGIVRASQLTQRIVNEICFDFFSYYGEGRLAPKFYFILGRKRDKVINSFALNMMANYSIPVLEYRNQLPLTRKSDLTQEILNANYEARFIRVEELNSPEMFATLYGDVRLVFVDDLEEVREFIDKWRDNIGTVAINWEDDPEILDLLEDEMVIRICNVGDMQFPDFFEQYDAVDDFNVYVSDDYYDDVNFEDYF